MLEILALIGLYGAISKMAQSKGLPKWWGWLGVGMWIGGELLGFVIGPAITGEPEGAYLFALLGALSGGLTAYAIVKRKAPAAELEPVEQVSSDTAN